MDPMDPMDPGSEKTTVQVWQEYKDAVTETETEIKRMEHALLSTEKPRASPVFYPSAMNRFKLNSQAPCSVPISRHLVSAIVYNGKDRLRVLTVGEDPTLTDECDLKDETRQQSTQTAHVRTMAEFPCRNRTELQNSVDLIARHLAIPTWIPMAVKSHGYPIPRWPHVCIVDDTCSRVVAIRVAMHLQTHVQEPTNDVIHDAPQFMRQCVQVASLPTTSEKGLSIKSVVHAFHAGPLGLFGDTCRASVSPSPFRDALLADMTGCSHVGHHDGRGSSTMMILGGRACPVVDSWVMPLLVAFGALWTRTHAMATANCAYRNVWVAEATKANCAYRNARVEEAIKANCAYRNARVEEAACQKTMQKRAPG